MSFLIFMVILIAALVWLAITTAGTVLIVCLIDGCQYGGPRFRDWRDPVFTIGGVLIFVAIMVGILAATFSLFLPFR